MSHMESQMQAMFVNALKAKEEEMPPEGCTHEDEGPSIVRWIRVKAHTHDYWCEGSQRWVTFERASNLVRDHWRCMGT